MYLFILGLFGKVFLNNAQRKRRNNIRRRELFPLKVRKNGSKIGADEHYGLAEELPPDDLSLEELEIKKKDFIRNLKVTDRGKNLFLYKIININI